MLDLGTFEVVKDIETGIAAEALGWIAPDRLVAFLLSGEVVVVDPRSGQRGGTRESLGGTSCPFNPPSAVTPLGFVMLVAAGGSATVAMVDAQGRVQRLRLDDISLGYARGVCEKAGLAVDPARLVAYVAGAGARVAAIDLRTMRGRRHALLAGQRLPRVRRAAQRGLARRWSPRGHGLRRPALAARRPAGVGVVDTRNWTARTIAQRAGAARMAGRRLLVYDGRHPSGGPRAGSGVRVYDRAGHLRRTLLAGERVGDVQVAGGRVYARTPRGLRVVDAAQRPRDRAPPAGPPRRRSDRAALNAALHVDQRHSRYPRTHATFPSSWSCFRRVPLSWKLPHYITQPA